MSAQPALGSEGWFRLIATILQSVGLKGIELHDFAGQQISPPVNVTFLISFNSEANTLLQRLGEIPGLREVGWFYVRGNRGEKFDGVVFDFYPPTIPPSKDILEKVATEFNLTHPGPPYWTWDTQYFGRFAPELYT